MRAFVLSGGGNRGALQAGALEVLLGEGVVPELVVGTSVGAINAAFVAATPTPAGAGELVRLWGRIGGREIFPGRPAEPLLRLLRHRDHLYPPAGLRRLLERTLSYRRIEEAAVPLVVVATELASGVERRLRRGPVVEAVLASAAIPGVFPPVAWEGELLGDGGLVANVPLGAALAAGADEVWVLDTSGPCTGSGRARTVVDAALQAIAVMGGARARAELACPPGPAVVHHLALRCRTDRWFTDFSATSELLAHGAAAARTYVGQEAGNVLKETDLHTENFYENVKGSRAGPSAVPGESEASR